MTGLDTEKSDANASAVLKAVVYLLLATALVAGGLVYLTHGLVSMEVRSDPAPEPLAVAPGRLPPEPRLQTLPFVDIEAQRAEEHSVLASYGWVDEKAGTVRIPIDEAMRLVAKRGLPVASAVPVPASSPESKK